MWCWLWLGLRGGGVSSRRTQSGSTVGGRKHVIAPVCFLQIRTVLKDYGGLELDPSQARRPAAPENCTFKRLKGTKTLTFILWLNKSSIWFNISRRSIFPAVHDHKNELEFLKKRNTSLTDCVPVSGPNLTTNYDTKVVPQHLEQMIPNWITLGEEF